MADVGEDDEDAGYQPNAPTKSAIPMPPTRPAGIGEDDEDAAKMPVNAPPASPPNPVYSGSFLPATRYSDGNVSFDPNAGVLGKAQQAAKGIWSGLTYPGDVAQGKATADPGDPNNIRRALDLTAITSPDAAFAAAKNIATPTRNELYDVAGNQYTDIRNMGVNRTVGSLGSVAKTVQDGLNNDGALQELAPNTHAMLDKLQNPPAGAVAAPMSGIIAARRSFGEIAKNYNNPTDQMAAKRAQSAIDDYIANPDPASVLSGPAALAGQKFKEANGNYAAASRSDVINQRGDYAQYKANDSNAGQNLPNNLRKQASYFLDPTHPARGAGFSDAELDALKQVNQGTVGTNTARTVGSWLGAGHGVFAGAGIAGAAAEGYNLYGLPGLAMGAAPPLAGMAAKSLEKKWTQQQFDAADEMVRQRSPLYQERAASAPVQGVAHPGAMSVSRAPPAIATSEPSNAEPPSPNSAAQPMLKAKKGAALPPSMTPDEAAAYVQQHQGETFARGGSVKRKKTHEELVSRLMSASEKAKAATKRETKAILGVPDNTVAKALEVAQKAI